MRILLALLFSFSAMAESYYCEGENRWYNFEEQTKAAAEGKRCAVVEDEKDFEFLAPVIVEKDGKFVAVEDSVRRAEIKKQQSDELADRNQRGQQCRALMENVDWERVPDPALRAIVRCLAGK